MTRVLQQPKTERQYQHEIAQKQKRENKLARQLEYHKLRHRRLELENESLRQLVSAFGLPRKQMEELGRALVDIFGTVPS